MEECCIYWKTIIIRNEVKFYLSRYLRLSTNIDILYVKDILLYGDPSCILVWYDCQLLSFMTVYKTSTFYLEFSQIKMWGYHDTMENNKIPRNINTFMFLLMLLLLQYVTFCYNLSVHRSVDTSKIAVVIL